jgi:hypothetical protein
VRLCGSFSFSIGHIGIQRCRGRIEN